MFCQCPFEYNICFLHQLFVWNVIGGNVCVVSINRNLRKPLHSYNSKYAGNPTDSGIILRTTTLVPCFLKSICWTVLGKMFNTICLVRSM